jgi:hypothetical protein
LKTEDWWALGYIASFLGLVAVVCISAVPIQAMFPDPILGPAVWLGWSLSLVIAFVMAWVWISDKQAKQQTVGP